jgi:hypothetical protein
MTSDLLTPLENYPGFAISPDGDVWRTSPTSRGRFAGSGPRRVVPTIHPRGHRWYVQVVDASGKRCRVPVSRLVETTFGVDSATASL